jgi:hypothetical protein
LFWKLSGICILDGIEIGNKRKIPAPWTPEIQNVVGWMKRRLIPAFRFECVEHVAFERTADYRRIERRYLLGADFTNKDHNV